MPATALEQMLLELINRARLDPAAEAARFGIDLNEGVPSNQTISPVSKQPLAMNETLLLVARAHSQDMIDRDYFEHDTPEGVTASQRIANAGYSAIGSGENIAFRSTSGSVTTAMTLMLHQDFFVDAGIPGRGHRLNLLQAAFQEVGVGQVTGNFPRDFERHDADPGFRRRQLAPVPDRRLVCGHRSRQFLFHRRRPQRNVGRGWRVSTSTGAAGGYSLSVGTGVQNVTFSGGGLSAPINVAVTLLGNTNAKVDVVDQNVVYTSASLTDLGGAATIIGLGTIGLTLTGDGGADTIVGTKGNDTLNGAGGTDIAVFSGARSAYTISAITGGFQIIGPDGTDQLFNIENAQFSDQTISLGSIPPRPTTAALAREHRPSACIRPDIRSQASAISTRTARATCCGSILQRAIPTSGA